MTPIEMWILGIVASSFVSLLAYLFRRDRNVIEQTGRDNANGIKELRDRMDSDEKESAIKLEGLREEMAEITHNYVTRFEDVKATINDNHTQSLVEFGKLTRELVEELGKIRIEIIQSQLNRKE